MTHFLSADCVMRSNYNFFSVLIRDTAVLSVLLYFDNLTTLSVMEPKLLTL